MASRLLHSERSSANKMTLKIENSSDDTGTTIKLIGRMQEEHIQELKALIGHDDPRVSLDLEQLGLIDVVAVRFLAACEAEGIRIVGSSVYIRDWIDKEGDQPDEGGSEAVM